MKLEILFSSNNKIGSKLISFAAQFEDLKLDNIPSHVAILLNNKWVYESTIFSGIRVVPYKAWLKINKELYKIKLDNSVSYKHILDRCSDLWGKKYDKLGFLYFAMRYLGLVLFNRRLPETNAWQDPNRYLCTELLGNLLKRDFSMRSPASICYELLNRSSYEVPENDQF